jgi:hypothetical protein
MVKPSRKGADDVRKKRGSRQVVESGPSSCYDRDESPKKLKSRERAVGPKDEDGVSGSNSKSPAPGTTLKEPSTQESLEIIQERSVLAAAQGTSWDLESALHHVVSMGDGCKEFLSDDAWVIFRVGHVGDASALEKCYRKSRKDGDNELSVTPEQMEVRLADGLGDEDNPPSIFALIAEVKSKSEDVSRDLAAAALFGGDDNSEVVRVEWIHVNGSLPPAIASILERRLWLRLSALSLLLSYDIIVEQDTRKKKDEEVGTE